MSHVKNNRVDELRNVINYELEAVKSFTELLAAIERADEEEGESVWQQSKVNLSVLGEWLYENVQRNIDGVFQFIEDKLGTIELAWNDPSIYGYREEQLTDIGLRLEISPAELMEKVDNS